MKDPVLSTQTSSPIRVAIAGQGRSGYNIHARCIRSMPDRFQVVAAADQLPERQREAADEFGARACDHWQALIHDGDYDLFVNALPSNLHVQATIAALNAGKHVLCEKPMAATVAELDRMTAAARANGVRLFPFQNNRLQPFFDRLQQVLASGVLGELVYIRSCWGRFARRWDWQTWQDNLGGSLFNTGPHAIDQALALIGWETKLGVRCHMSCHNAFGADAEDHAAITLVPKAGGPQVDIVISAHLAYAQGDMYNIGGTHGGLTGGATELHWRYFDPDAAPTHDMWQWSVDRKYTREELPWQEDSWRLDDQQQREAVGYTLKSFPSGPERIYDNIHAILRGEDVAQVVTLDQVRPQIAVLEECHRQAPLPTRR